MKSDGQILLAEKNPSKGKAQKRKRVSYKQRIENKMLSIRIKIGLWEKQKKEIISKLSIATYGPPDSTYWLEHTNHLGCTKECQMIVILTIKANRFKEDLTLLQGLIK